MDSREILRLEIETCGKRIASQIMLDAAAAAAAVEAATQGVDAAKMYEDAYRREYTKAINERATDDARRAYNSEVVNGGALNPIHPLVAPLFNGQGGAVRAAEILARLWVAGDSEIKNLNPLYLQVIKNTIRNVSDYRPEYVKDLTDLADKLEGN